MVDSDSITDNYKSLTISIAAIIENPEMLNFVPEHLKTKKMCKHEAKNWSSVIRYAFHQYKTQQMCQKSII